ncbi:RNA-directed DNA polymerase [Vibrio fluvialis]|uniref:antiviral reverse transcriptase Drt3a n=2 Tax=Vibrio fluvialis TaxID=676 RepID=UPI00192BA82A|nr:antiviral reverse transcriptase Drt3a [Vibrio fluvialis]MBL4258427.1 RNA-directed DNA polymerase [Vibrio fluvialis]MBY7999087.1 RNA-directed DNA polymerase [Vibrio fluvialis]
MNELAYIPRHFRKCVKYKNLIKIDEFKDNDKLTEACSRAYKKVQTGHEWANAIHTTLVKKKKAYTLNTPESILVNNLIINNISSKYRTKCVDRDVTIRLLISHIRDSYAFTVHRLDVKSFYESFDRRNIIYKLKSDAKLSRKTLSTLENLFQELDNFNVDGLPRGMGVSSTLSELMMNDFDAYLRSTKGVLFYCRFVDDIIILTTPNITKNKLSEVISQSPLPQKLEFHNSGSKVAYKMIRKTSEDSERIEKFDFLGYQFKVKSKEREIGETLKVGRRLLDVEISDEKIEKIKKRIIKSFCKFISSKKPLEDKLPLLRKRLYFLSKNYPLINASDNSQVLSGIYFNYKHISNPEKISEIDKFYRSLLFGRKSNLSKRIRKNLSYKDRYILSNISFIEGFNEKRFCKFSYKDFKDIKQAWL